MSSPISSSFLGNAATYFRALAKSRHSAKRFEINRTIPSSILSDIMKTTITSPSGFNLQPTHVILVNSGELKSQLADTAMLGPGNAFRTRDCSVLAVFICDVQLHKRIPRIFQLEREAGLRDANYLASFPVVTSFLLSGENAAMGDGLVSGGVARTLKRVATDLVSPMKPAPTMESVEAWCKNVEDNVMIPKGAEWNDISHLLPYKNASLLAATWVFSATSHGLATCIMEGYDARRAAQTLRIPYDRYKIPMMVATGYEYMEQSSSEGEARHPTSTPRLPIQDVFFHNSFGQPWSDEEHNGD